MWTFSFPNENSVSEDHLMARLLVNIDVKNLVQAKEFYTRAFDLRTGRSFGDAGIELFCGDTALYLLVKDEGSKPFHAAGAADARRFERHWTPVHLDFVVDDLDSAIEKVKAAGGIFAESAEPRVANWGKIVEFSDPFGNGICLVQFLGRGYDEISSP